MRAFLGLVSVALGLFFPNSAYAKTHIVSYKNQDSVVTVSQVDTLDVVLNANPSTGYSWEVATPIVQWLVLTGS